MLTVRPMDYLWPEVSLDGECGTRFTSADIPFMILGVPVYRDYIVVHSDDNDGPGHMNFKHGFSDTKFTPEENWRLSERKLAIKYEFE